MEESSSRFDALNSEYSIAIIKKHWICFWIGNQQQINQRKDDMF